MAGGGQNLDPGTFVSIATPLMKVAGLMIASRGGALGPGLVGGAELIDEGYASRRKSAVLQQLAGMMKPVQETASTPGLPAVPARAFQPGDVEGLGTPRVEAAPEVPGVPATSRTWMREPTRPELISQIEKMPQGTLRNLTLEEVMRLRLPSDVERPKTVEEDLAQARAKEAEAARLRDMTPFLGEARARASLAAGSVLPEPLPSEKFVARGLSAVQPVDPRTGKPLGPPVEQRTAEQEQARRDLVTVKIPQAEANIRAMVQNGQITPKEAAALHAQLVEAARTGSMKGYADEVGKIAAAKAKQPPGMRLSTRRTTQAARPVTNPDVINNYKARVPDVVSALKQRGYVGFDDPKAANVRSPSGKTLTKEQAVSEVFRMWYGYKPDLGRDASGNLSLTGLWIPEHVSESSTETGPALPSEAAGGD